MTGLKRILLIEDNVDLAFGLQATLEVEGYETRHARTGSDGLVHTRAYAPDLILLDIMLPDVGGYEVLRRLRAEGTVAPVLILSARGEEVDKVQGFRLGADDYVVKPVGVLELLARVEALIRRSRPEGAPVYRRGELIVDIGRRAVCVCEQEIALSPIEFDLLHALVKRDGALVSRAELLREVWGYRADVESRTVDTHVAKLRAKIDPDDSGRIFTVRKKGYRLR